ncbi:MAG: hypothetical protein U0165_02195 [Polyangiaceae bacterium]
MLHVRRVVVVSMAFALIAIACSGPTDPKGEPNTAANSSVVDVAVPSASSSGSNGSVGPTRPGASAVIAECQSDSDCVPASCCHATECVPASAKPNCDNAMCTRDCKGGTLDCGGSCGCEAKKCVAHLSQRKFPRAQ